jgi:hypothetical protein
LEIAMAYAKKPKTIKWNSGSKKTITKTYKASKMVPVDGQGCQKRGKKAS